jgi:hypothetical protein
MLKALGAILAGRPVAVAINAHCWVYKLIARLRSWVREIECRRTKSTETHTSPHAKIYD